MGLDLVELVMRTEEVFAIDLPDEECERVRTVGDLYRLVLDKLDLTYVSASEVETEVLGRVAIVHSALKLTEWTTPDVWLTLKAVIHDQLGVKPSHIVETARFVDDLGCD